MQWVIIENCFCHPPTCSIKIKELSYFNFTFFFSLRYFYHFYLISSSSLFFQWNYNFFLNPQNNFLHNIQDWRCDGKENSKFRCYWFLWKCEYFVFHFYLLNLVQLLLKIVSPNFVRNFYYFLCLKWWRWWYKNAKRQN